MFNFFGYVTKLLRSIAVVLISVLGVGLLHPAGPDATFEMEKVQKYEERAKILATSYERNFFDKDNGMLHANSNNWASMAGCWDNTALLTMYTKLAIIDSKYLSDVDTAIYSLGFYGRTKDGKFNGYTGTWVPLQNRSTGDVYYDDNMWVGRDMVTLYRLTGEQKYLDTATAIADMIISEGWVDLDEDMFTQEFGRAPGGPIGGFYWNSDHNALHVCSNGPAAQFLAMLSTVVDSGKADEYLEYAQKCYRFFKYLEKDNGVFWDLTSFQKDENNRIIGIDKSEGTSYSYNSGTPISSALELYKITGDAAYLDDAMHWAECADTFFAKDSGVEGFKSYSDLPWFREILLMSYTELYEYDQNALTYIQNMENSINYAYENYRLNGVLGYNENLMPKDWVNGFTNDAEKKSGYTLEQFPCAGIYASLALFYAGIE